uniref:Glutamyl-tRNA reductase n=1 Tax=Rhizophora mucronata TaxID=61149 RepID=A0A2P2P4L4_RHIMU
MQALNSRTDRYMEQAHIVTQLYPSKLKANHEGGGNMSRSKWKLGRTVSYYK